MKESNQLATSFITPYGSYCYITMPFGLKNTGATYQRCMQQCFADQIDPPDQPDQAERSKPTIAIYVDDIVVKTAQACNLIANLATTFVNLRRFNTKLNPEKCVFGDPKGKLLRYIVSECGIEANPKKSRHLQHGPYTQCQGRTEAHWLFGCPELVHLPTRQEGDASL